MPKKAAPTKAAAATTTTATKGKTSTTTTKGTEAKNPLIERRPRNFGIGQAVRPKRNLSRYVKWPRYVLIQRQRKVLLNRLKVPPAINQFTRSLDKQSATQLFKLLNKYRPESKLQKKQRLLKAAEAKTKGETVQTPTPRSSHVHFGLNKVTKLIERKEAKLVVIAHDVDPIELVVWVPTLCKKMGVPYVIIKGKSRLGAVVHMKNTALIALTSVEKEDLKDFSNLTELATQSFNNNPDIRRTWGGGKLGTKTMAVQKKKERAVAKEQAAKMSA